MTCENRSFELTAIYRSGQNPKDGKAVPISTFFGNFMEILDSHDTATYDLVITGDLNFHVNDDNNIEATQFSEIMSTYNLTQLVQDPTNESGYTVDLVITRALSNFVKNVTVGQKISDHFAEKDWI